jgi:hypothetical protein
MWPRAQDEALDQLMQTYQIGPRPTRASTLPVGGMSGPRWLAYVLGMIEDPYEVLQVHRNAELDVIRAAFRTLARKYHPDFGGTGARMVSLNEAWAILGDPKTRATYDKAQAIGVMAAAASATATPTETNLYSASSSAPPPPSTAPSGRPGEKVLDFGRYAGWSLRDLARQDPYYLEWLARMPIGRPLRAEIDELLAAQAATPTVGPSRVGGSATATKTPFRLRRRGR